MEILLSSPLLADEFIKIISLSAARLRSSWGLDLLSFFLHNPPCIILFFFTKSLLSSSVWPDPSSRGHKLFYPWITDTGLCTARPVFPTVSSFGTWHQSAPASWRILCSWIPLSFRSTFSASPLTRPKAALWKSKVGVLLHPSLLLWESKTIFPWSPGPRWPLAVPSLTRLSLLLNNRANGHFPHCLAHQLSRSFFATHFRNLLGCFLCALLYFQHCISSMWLHGQLMCPTRTRDSETPSCLFLLVGWSTEVSHHDICLAGSPPVSV